MPTLSPTAPAGLQKLIKEIAEKEDFKNYETKCNILNTDGANYMGTLYLIDIREGTRELNLFGKVSNTPEAAREFIKANAGYSREVSLYTKIANIFADLETKHAVPEDDRYKIIKYYGSDLTELEEVVVLENIAEQGYVMFDRFKSVDWEFASAAVEELAKFHALSYALKNGDPEKFEKLIKSKKTLFVLNDDSDNFKKVFFNIAKAACDKEHIPALNKFLEGINEIINNNNLPDEYSVLVHADYKPSNIMVKYEEGRIKSLIPVDYQTIFHGSPINDLMYLLVAGSDQEFRNNYYDSYVQHYYDSLAISLARLSLDINVVYPRAVFDQHLREKLRYGLAMAVIILPFMLMAPEEAPDFENIEDSISQLKSLKLYNERFRGIVQDMVKWSVLKV